MDLQMTSTQVINQFTLEILHTYLACGAPAGWVQAAQNDKA